MKCRAVTVTAMLILLGAGSCVAGPGMECPMEAPVDQASTVVEHVVFISVYDNYGIAPELKTGWGFATVIRTPGEVILFDTGGDWQTLLFNMDKMNIAPESIDTVFISHIHADHVGGLKGFLESNNDVNVFIPSSFPDSVRNMIRSKGARFTDVSGPQKICDHVFSAGELFGPPEEQSLIVDTENGLVVVTGCAHPGIVNIIENAKRLFPNKRIYMAMGGFHSPPIAAVAALRALGVQNVAPSHCTGDRAIEAFKKEYGTHFMYYGVGKTIDIGEMERE